MPSNGDRKARVLVVDDERSMRELLAIVLKREGYEVITAEKRLQPFVAVGCRRKAVGR